MNIFNPLMASYYKKKYGGSGGGNGGWDGHYAPCPNAKQFNAKIGVGEYAFFENQDIKSVAIPISSDIRKCAFVRCKNLETVNLGYDVFGDIDPNLVFNIGESAFRECDNLKTVVAYPVNHVGENAFMDNINLEYVEIKNTNSRPYYSPLVSIGSNAFRRCIGLKEFRASVTDVGEYAFGDCENLEKIRLHSCASVGSFAFYKCSKLTAVILYGDIVCACSLDAFNYTPVINGEGYIYINSSMWDAYARVYGNYMAIFRKIEDYPEICG